jgi:GDPmannose 4,6-dehydratase
MKTCLILGSTGQDGSFLVENCLKNGMRVVCGYRKTANPNTENLDALLANEKYKDVLELAPFDLSDHTSIYRLIADYKPDWIFNEADQDHVGWSYKLPAYSMQVTIEAVTALCEAVRLLSPESRIFLPVSSNIYGEAHAGAISSEFLVSPVSPYGVAKAAVLHLSNYYRKSHNLNITTGILFNHESHKRSEEYLTRKLAKAVAEIKIGKRDSVAFGDLDTEVDWGCANEFTEIFIDLMKKDFNGNVVIGTGNLCRVGDLVEFAFAAEGLDAKQLIKQDKRFMRPVKMAPIFADLRELTNIIGRSPVKPARDVISEMVAWEKARLEAL